MSNAALNYVFKNSKTVGSARVLMLAIADMANDDGECWPGKAKLHKKVNVSVRTITRLIQECERLGELAVIQGEQNQPNRYIVIGVAAEKRVEKARPIRERKPRAKRVTNVTSVAGDTSDTGDTRGSDTGDTRGSDTGVTQTQIKPTDITHNVQDAKAPARNRKSESKQKPRNLHFDAIVEAFGYDPNGMTPSEKKLVGKVSSELKTAGVEPSEVGSLYAWCKRQGWRSVWGPAALSNNVSNWRKTLKPTDGARPPVKLQEATPEDKAALVREYVA